MENAQRLAKRFFALTSEEQDMFLKMSGLKRIPGFVPAETLIPKQRIPKPPKPPKEPKVQTESSLAAVYFNGLSFEERMKFEKEARMERKKEKEQRKRDKLKGNATKS